MAKITERLAYRIAGIAWTAIYARLCVPSGSATHLTPMQAKADSATLPAPELAAA